MRADCSNVACYVNVDGLRLTRAGIVDLDRSELFDDDRVRTGGGGFEIETIAMHRLGNLLRLGVVGETTHRTVEVGEKVNWLAYPHGIVVVRVLSRNFRNARVFQVGNPNGGGLTAAIALPCRLPLRMRYISDARGIGRECCFFTNGNGQLGWESAFDGHRVELVLEVHEAVSKRRKENLLAVRRPAENIVLCGMISQPPWDAARGWNYVHVTIAVVLAGKRH